MVHRWSVLFAIAACSAPSGSPADAPGPFAGVYATAVALERNTCTGIQVRDMPTTVSQGPGAADLTLRHAGTAYTGTVELDGAFSTMPRIVGSPADTHTLTITGRFVTDGFTATVHADVIRNGSATCDYDVGWIGTRGP